jgi:ATP-binding cassette, subfamily B (MDR/TAP), member 1
MWPFALLALACVPLMAFGSSMEMKKVLGEDQGTADDSNEGLNSPGGIVVETLLNMRTVAALTLEKTRFENYKEALIRSSPNYVWESFQGGFISGLSMFIQQWINALQFWWGGWLLVNYPHKFVMEDFLISNFALLFGMFGLGSAFQDLADTKEVEKSAGRIFHILDRKSAIDPLSTEGKVLDGSSPIDPMTKALISAVAPIKYPQKETKTLDPFSDQFSDYSDEISV